MTGYDAWRAQMRRGRSGRALTDGRYTPRQAETVQRVWAAGAELVTAIGGTPGNPDSLGALAVELDRLGYDLDITARPR